MAHNLPTTSGVIPIRDLAMLAGVDQLHVYVTVKELYDILIPNSQDRMTQSLYLSTQRVMCIK
jgi:hypothetical protein